MTSEKLINKYISAFFILTVGTFLFLGLREFFSAFLGAIVFYTLFKPFYRYLHFRRKLRPSIAAIIIIVISFLIVVLPVGTLFTVIFNKISAVASDPEMIQNYNKKLLDKMEHLPFKVSVNNTTEKVQTLITSNVGRVLNSSLMILGSILMMYFFLFFLLINSGRMEASVVHYLPFSRTKIKMFGKELIDQTYSNAIGVPLVCIAQGFAAYLSYRIAGLPEAGLWGILTGFASIIPLVGTAIIWVPASVFLLADGQQWQGIFVAVYSIVIMSNVDNLIRMIVSKKIGDVHPVITVLGVIFGLKYFGLPGLVFGPLLISYFLILLRLYYIEYGNLKQQTRALGPNETNLIKLVLNHFNVFAKTATGAKKIK
jgi:predicted PurR-regulated permease PerM